MPKNRDSGSRKWVDPDDAPELDREFFQQADLYEGDKLVRRGRPKIAAPKQAINIRLSPDVLAHFRATGPRWQSRIDAVLKAHIAKRR